jgi:hypothetical protein
VPDLFVLHRGIAHMIEIKTPAGVLSDAQRSAAAAMLVAGGHVGVARDAEAALACLDAWGILRTRCLVLRAHSARVWGHVAAAGTTAHSSTCQSNVLLDEFGYCR